ncbi:DUF1642 domain-containing protein [Enterococcus avium]|uniref:DUF1642 domain-containing protein n=1 Tax=Enterococcus avium TaxID=33945 RepID=UPI00288F3892|nr:DUF1642 domain-containing protein [Enterococcus avium]MDT2502231.1 DUF1642 domain-containing protein [Enterococcus avium]
MEKQDLIKEINKEKYDFSKPETSLNRSDYKEGYNDACDDILDIIFKQLDEPQKVKVPEFVVEWFKENKHNLNFAIYELCEAGKVPVDLYEGLTDFERWFYLNHDIDTLIRMQDGYEVEEEPKWVLKHQNGMYFTRFNEEMEPLLGGEKRAYRFTDESKAEALTIFFNGTVEKV